MIHGGKILVYKKNGNNWVSAIAAAKSCDIEISCDTIEVSSPSTGTWKTSIVGRKSWSVNVGALVSEVEQMLIAGTEVELKIYNADTTSDSVTGNAIIKSCQMTGTKGNLAQFSVVFEGTGALAVT